MDGPPGTFGFVVSHPFARKTANGWGTAQIGSDRERRGLLTPRSQERDLGHPLRNVESRKSLAAFEEG